jgi:hypothetical protein
MSNNRNSHHIKIVHVIFNNSNGNTTARYKDFLFKNAYISAKKRKKAHIQKAPLRTNTYSSTFGALGGREAEDYKYSRL